VISRSSASTAASARRCALAFADAVFAFADAVFAFADAVFAFAVRVQALAAAFTVGVAVIVFPACVAVIVFPAAALAIAAVLATAVLAAATGLRPDVARDRGRRTGPCPGSRSPGRAAPADERGRRSR